HSARVHRCRPSFPTRRSSDLTMCARPDSTATSLAEQTLPGKKETTNMSAKVTSKDDTEIAYDSVGTGPALVVVAGATQFRAFDSDRKSTRLNSSHVRSSYAVC